MPLGLVETLETIAERLAETRAVKHSWILIRATGTGGGDFLLECGPRKAKVVRAQAPTSPPTIEIIGEAKYIQPLLRGEHDPRKLFFAGKLRVRGDLAYLSALALELGILKAPL